MTTITVSEKTLNNIKEEQASIRKETGKTPSANKIIENLFEMYRKVKK